MDRLEALQWGARSHDEYATVSHDGVYDVKRAGKNLLLSTASAVSSWPGV